MILWDKKNRGRMHGTPWTCKITRMPNKLFWLSVYHNSKKPHALLCGANIPSVDEAKWCAEELIKDYEKEDK